MTLSLFLIVLGICIIKWAFSSDYTPNGDDPNFYWFNKTLKK